MKKKVKTAIGRKVGKTFSAEFEAIAPSPKDVVTKFEFNMTAPQSYLNGYTGIMLLSNVMELNRDYRKIGGIVPLLGSYPT